MKKKNWSISIYLFYSGETRRGVICVSNYRLYVTTPQGHINLPLGLIEQVRFHHMGDWLIDWSFIVPPKPFKQEWQVGTRTPPSMNYNHKSESVIFSADSCKKKIWNPQISRGEIYWFIIPTKRKCLANF